jgi:glycerol-3-phosphate acyltransferase PlsY
MSPVVFPILVALWFVLSKLTKKASLASIIVVALLPVGVGIVRQEAWEVAATIGLCALVMIRHLGNIKRLVTRKEHALT